MKTACRRLIAVVVLIAVGLALGGLGTWRASLAAYELEVSRAVIVRPPAGRDIAAGYMTIRSNMDDRLVAVSSEMIGHIEIHRSVAGGQGLRVRMERVDSVVLRAHRETTFAPGGLHLMLFGADQLQPGQEMEMILHTASGRQIRASFTVTTRPPERR